MIVLGAQLQGSVISCLFYIPNRKGLYEEIVVIISRRNCVSKEERCNLIIKHFKFPPCSDATLAPIIAFVHTELFVRAFVAFPFLIC